MTKIRLLTVLFFAVCYIPLLAQENYKVMTKADSMKIYYGGPEYKVKTYKHNFKSQKPKNIIMMIGDGMGVSHVYAGLTANHGNLFLDNFKSIGFLNTH